jgi:hypothetical protein
MSTNTQLVQVPPQAVLIQLGMGFIVSQAISVAARLRIADYLQDGAKSCPRYCRVDRYSRCLRFIA